MKKSILVLGIIALSLGLNGCNDHPHAVSHAGFYPSGEGEEYLTKVKKVEAEMNQKGGVVDSTKMDPQED